jgi:hypothetical protein
MPSGIKQVAENLSVEENYPSAAEAALNSYAFKYGLKAVPFRNKSFSAACKAQLCLGPYGTTTAFSLPVLTERPLPTRLFLKKSRTSLPCPVQSRSENALKVVP